MLGKDAYIMLLGKILKRQRNKINKYGQKPI